MLKSLTVQNLVVIERLAIEFQSGLNVLTGETGAGKSILLDGLGLVLGQRASQGLVRAGADKAVVHAAFDCTDRTTVKQFLSEHDLEAEDDSLLLLRRTLHKDGRSRAFINDQPVHLRLLKELGDQLVEVHGQHSETGLTQQNVHRELLDIFGDTGTEKAGVAAAYQTWRQAVTALDALETALAAQQAQQDDLTYAAEELRQLAPTAGEEAQLTERRTQLRAAERIADALQEATAVLNGHDGVDRRLYVAERALQRIVDHAEAVVLPALEALRRASSEAQEAAALVEQAGYELSRGEDSLNRIEERLFALREAARKYKTDIDGLGAYLDHVESQLLEFQDNSKQRAVLLQNAKDTRTAFEAATAGLSAARRRGADRLDRKVGRELPALSLEKAHFQTELTSYGEENWGPEGGEKVAFLIATNPGVAPAPLAKIASGGELSRFMLALKVALSARMPGRTMVFDEVDAGVGGAVADKVGRRLQLLAKENQVLVVTHAPQVAARGNHHLLIRKTQKAEETSTEVTPLSPAARREEIARMLAGAKVTDAARRAADSLLDEPASTGKSPARNRAKKVRSA